jgi:hypothetical protein
LTGRRCMYDFCWLCMASYTQIRRVGNTAHEETCKYYSAKLLAYVQGWGDGSWWGRVYFTWPVHIANTRPRNLSHSRQIGRPILWPVMRFSRLRGIFMIYSSGLTLRPIERPMALSWTPGWMRVCIYPVFSFFFNLHDRLFKDAYYREILNPSTVLFLTGAVFLNITMKWEPEPVLKSDWRKQRSNLGIAVQIFSHRESTVQNEWNRKLLE